MPLRTNEDNKRDSIEEKEIHMSIKNTNIIFDFDSTIVKLETIEVLANFALKENKNKSYILDTIKELTYLAMSGKIPFDEALNKRISLLNINKKHRSFFIKNYFSRLTHFYF